MGKFTFEYQGDELDSFMEFDSEKSLEEILDNVKRFLQSVGYAIGYDEMLELSLPDAESIDIAIPQFGLKGELTGVYMRELDNTLEFVPIPDKEDLIAHIEATVPLPFKIQDTDLEKDVELRNGEVLAIYMIKTPEARSTRPIVLSNGVSYPRNGLWYNDRDKTESPYDIIRFTTRRL